MRGDERFFPAEGPVGDRWASTGLSGLASMAAPGDGAGPILPAPEAETKPLRHQIFDHVRGAGRSARADVVRALGVSAGSVTTLTSDLIARGFLREVDGVHGPRDGARGRPPVALEVVPDARLVIGVKLSDQRHSAVLADFTGTVLAEVAIATTALRKSPERIAHEVAALAADLSKTSGRALTDVAAVGVGLPGLVDHHAGVVMWSPLLADRNVALRAALERQLGCAAHIDNDANMLTLAELWFGAGRAMSDFAVVTIEGGVGMGAVLNGRLFRGTRGMGLELGHTKVQLDGALCRCGRRGCLEAYLADYALAREASTALGRTTGTLQSPSAMLETLYAEAKAGHAAARSIFRRAGRYLAVGLSNVVQIFDPELIILSGERITYDYLYADEVLAEIRALTLSDGRTPARIEVHAWGDMVWARGASALALAAVTATALGEARATGGAG